MLQLCACGSRERVAYSVAMTKISLSPLGANNPILRARFFVVVASVVSFGSSFAGVQKAGVGMKWVAPVERVQRNNPIPANESSLAAGRMIYLARCAACHGRSGDGDGNDAIAFGFHAARLSNPRLRDEPDGALYWKITTGKKPMPDYGSRLSATDRWNVINYLRTLSQGKQTE